MKSLEAGMVLVAACVCAGATAGSASAKPQTGTDQLQSEWVTGCAPIGKNGRHGSVMRLTIGRRTISATIQLYAKTNCDQPTLQGRYSGIVKAARMNDGRIELDYQVRDASVTLQREDVVGYYNGASSCGLSGWQLGKPKTVLGQRCGSLDVPAADQMLYESVWISGDELRMGAFPLDLSNRSPAARPQAPRPLIFRRSAATAQ
ncbi:MAG TPA: hypothetical protein VF637_02190 [Sphingomicrobium sp.]|jgi:hypothetical protein